MSPMLRASLLAVTILGSAPAFAQGAPTATEPPATAANSADSIVVTARKREETVLDVPIAVSAFSQARIEDKLAQNITDLAEFTPGLQIQEAFGRDGDRPVMRGASNILVTDGKVGIFLDGAPYFGDFSSLDLANAERVEVIKGPQAAVYGRGTLSGAINVVMKRPGDRLHGRISGTLGSFDRREFSAFVSSPVTDWLGVEAGIKLFDIDGQFRNTTGLKERLGNQNTKQYSAGIFLDPSPDISASVRWLHQTDNDGAFAIALQPSTFNNCFMTTRPYYCGRVTRPSTYALNTDKLQRPGLYRNADRFLGDLHWDLGGSGYELSFQAGYSDLIEVSGVDQSYDGRDFMLLGSVFACQNFVPIGNQKCTQSGFNSTDGSHRKTYTYEARITSPATDRFRWRLGVFASRDRTDPLRQYVEASEVGLDMLTDTRLVRNRAIFGGVDFDVTPELTLGAELRYQNDRVEAIGNRYRAGDLFSADYIASLKMPNPNQIIGVAGTRKAKFNATLPRVTANWKVAPDLSFYAQFAIGNAPGGFNPVGAPKSTYDEERLTNYEVGLKTTRFGFDFLNLSLFWQNYTNQVLTNTYQTDKRIDSYSVNIGRTRIRGLELEGAYPLIGRSLQLQFNYTFLDANIREGFEPERALQLLGTSCKTGTAVNLDLPGCRAAASVAGNRPPLVAKHTGAVGLRFNQDITDWNLFAGADLIYRSSSFAQVLNLARTGSATTANLQLGVQDNNGLKLTVWGKNVFGNRTPVGILRYVDLGPGVAKTPTGDSARAFAITPPRRPEYGLTLSKAF